MVEVKLKIRRKGVVRPGRQPWVHVPHAIPASAVGAPQMTRAPLLAISPASPMKRGAILHCSTAFPLRFGEREALFEEQSS